VSSYEQLAADYDSAYERAVLLDRPFYVHLALEHGGPVLEVGCGTGRILIPTAAVGVAIWGLDFSPAMIGCLEEKLATKKPEVRAHILELTVGDMRDFDLGRQFPLITMPFRPFQHMTTIDDQLAALACIKRHLAPGGRFVMDVFNVRWDLLADRKGTEAREMEWQDDDGNTVVRYFRTETVDTVNQCFGGTFLFRTTRDEKVIDEREVPFSMTFFTYPQMMLLFRLAGLEVVASYGGFDRSPITTGSPELIFVTTHAGT